jgi:hypothetical protein
MRLPLIVLGTELAVLLLAFELPAHAGSCPPGTVRQGNKCMRCPSGYQMQGNKCVRYSCRPGCTYIGGGKCRCRRR